MTDPNTTLGGAPRPKMQHTQTVVAQLASIPAEKRTAKLWRTAIGVAIAVFGWRMKAHWPGLSDLLAFGTVAFGAIMASGEYVRAPFKMFVAMLRDVLGVWRGNGGASNGANG
jgi:hypothetical protein